MFLKMYDFLFGQFFLFFVRCTEMSILICNGCSVIYCFEIHTPLQGWAINRTLIIITILKSFFSGLSLLNLVLYTLILSTSLSNFSIGGQHIGYIWHILEKCFRFTSHLSNILSFCVLFFFYIFLKAGHQTSKATLIQITNN